MVLIFNMTMHGSKKNQIKIYLISLRVFSTSVPHDLMAVETLVEYTHLICGRSIGFSSAGR